MSDGIKLNGVSWRFLTPFLIIVLGFMNGTSIFILNDIKTSVTKNATSIEKTVDNFVEHIADPDLHHAALGRLERDMAWVKDDIDEMSRERKKTLNERLKDRKS